MTREHSVAVVGAGIIGMSVAWRLAQAGCDVTVFDKGPVGGAASWAGAGMLAPGGEIEGDSPLVSLALESRKLYRDYVNELEEASGRRIDYQECGGLDLAYSEHEAYTLREKSAAQARAGIRSRWVPAEHIATLWPRVRRERLAGAVFYPDDAIVDPRQVTAALERACGRLGGQVRAGLEVRAVGVSGDGVRVHSSAQSDFDAAVIAAGAWSGSIKVHGVPPLPFSEPVKGQLIGFRQPFQTCNTILRRGSTYVLQRESGFLITGATAERVGFDESVSTVQARQLAAAAAFILPHLAETTPTDTWIGFRPGSDRAHIEKWHSDRLLLAYGHYRNGILLAPVTAKVLTEQITASLGM